MDDNRKEEEKKRPKPLTAEERERQEQEAYERKKQDNPRLDILGIVPTRFWAF